MNILDKIRICPECSKSWKLRDLSKIKLWARRTILDKTLRDQAARFGKIFLIPDNAENFCNDCLKRKVE